MLIVAGLGGLALVSLASAQWAGNPEEAYAAADRLLVYLLLAFVLLVVVRTDRAAAWLLGAVAAGAVVVMAWTIVRMLGSDAGSAFLGGRLHEPLGYINGQGAFFVIATWLFFAAAEQRRWPLLSGVGLAAAVLSGSLAVLSQSRGVALSALIAICVALALVPGRVRRVWTLAALGAGLAVALPSLLAVYGDVQGGPVEPATVNDAAAHRPGLRDRRRRGLGRADAGRLAHRATGALGRETGRRSRRRRSGRGRRRRARLGRDDPAHGQRAVRRVRPPRD